MSTVTSPPPPLASQATDCPPLADERGDQRIAIRNVSWQIYDLLSDAIDEQQHVFLAYDGKDLEIMTKGKDHENFREILLRLVVFLTSELQIRCRGLGETTWKRPEIERGLESDLCYFFAPEKRAAVAESIAKKTKGIEDTPNPDLAIEIDISPPQVDRPGIYAALQVPEIWRFEDDDFVIEHLQPDGTYLPVESSRFLWIRPDEIRRWVIEEDFSDELAWEQRLRAWARAELMPRINANG